STEVRFFDGGINEYVDLNVLDATPGFDNNNTVVGGDYNYDTGGRSMNWKYNTPDYGPLDAMFSCMVFYNYNATAGSNCTIKVHWFNNGNLVGEDILINSGENQGSDVRTSFRMFSVNVTDQISCKVLLDLYKWGGGGIVNCELSVDQFQVDYFRVPIGGQIAFDSYLSLQKYKFLDFLKGEVDLFNLNFQTDPTNKEVVIEPAHEYFVGNDSATKKQGYFSKNTINWSSKEDVSFESIIDIYDDNEREFVFKFKDDSNDGALKIVQDRYKITLAAAKYVFDERFKAEKKPFENRFYAATMHYLVDDFSGVTGEAPQMICLVPENISNTSSSEAQNTFIPKTAYYKGLVTGVGGWVFDGDNRTDYPFMFAVNYKQGGENDPILSYSDEKIGKKDLFVVGTGLLKRFFWQRLAIMNNGQWLTSKFNLNNTDITNWYHRERIDLNGELWELISIKNFIPGKNDSTKVMLRKWYPITEYEDKNTYPSKSSILTDAVVVNNQSQNNNNEIDKVFDTQYNQLMCLYGDIPR
ncbi:hypothetical protein, partial [Soonwooa sp.]|uniref:hypothetical protein n=1 Tax=Soonwooa sp. TaxID=1938592 RepID=UPI0028A79BB5